MSPYLRTPLFSCLYLHLFFCLPPAICQHIRLPICPYVHACCLSIHSPARSYVSLPTFLSVCLFVYPPVYLSLSPSIFPSVFQSVYPSICPSVYPSVYLSVYLFICISVRLFLHLSVYRSVFLSVCRFFL